MKVHSFIKDTIAMEQNEQAAIAVKEANYEHDNRAETSPATAARGEADSSLNNTEEKKEETRPTEEKKGKKGTKGKKDV